MTASIPTHRLFVHVRRLVAKGYKVSFGINLWKKGIGVSSQEGTISKVVGLWLVLEFGILEKLKFITIINIISSWHIIFHILDV